MRVLTSRKVTRTRVNISYYESCFIPCKHYVDRLRNELAILRQTWAAFHNELVWVLSPLACAGTSDSSLSSKFTANSDHYARYLTGRKGRDYTSISYQTYYIIFRIYYHLFVSAQNGQSVPGRTRDYLRRMGKREAAPRRKTNAPRGCSILRMENSRFAFMVEDAFNLARWKLLSPKLFLKGFSLLSRDPLSSWTQFAKRKGFALIRSRLCETYKMYAIAIFFEQI